MVSDSIEKQGGETIVGSPQLNSQPVEPSTCIHLASNEAYVMLGFLSLYFVEIPHAIILILMCSEFSRVEIVDHIDCRLV